MTFCAGLRRRKAVPWLSGMMGSKLRILPGSILGEERSLSWDALRYIHLDPADPWYRAYLAFIDTLVAHAGQRYPVSHGTLVGPSDMAAELRGHSQSIMDVLAEPEMAAALLLRLGEVFRQITEDAWKRIPLFHGGYFDAQYVLWAPGPIIRMQEDATGLYSPKLYRQSAACPSHPGPAFPLRFHPPAFHLHVHPGTSLPGDRRDSLLRSQLRKDLGRTGYWLCSISV